MTNKLKEDWKKTLEERFASHKWLDAVHCTCFGDEDFTWLNNFIAELLASQRKEIRRKLASQRYNALDKSAVDIGWNDGINYALSILQEMEGHEE